MKKLLFIALLLIALLPCAAPAESEPAVQLTDGYLYTLDADGSATIVGYADPHVIQLDVPETLKGAQVKAIGDAAFFRFYYLTEITLPEGLTHIGREAFGHCLALYRVDLPDTLLEIGDLAFYDCQQLRQMSFPRSPLRMGENPFMYCLLTDVSVPKEHLTLRLMGAALFDKISKTLITTLYTGEAEYTVPFGVERIGDSAFYGRDELVSVTLPESVREIGNDAFAACESLATLTLPEGLTHIGTDAFVRCPLSSLALPETLLSVGDGAFSSSGLTQLTIPASLTQFGADPFSTLYDDELTIADNHPTLILKDGALIDTATGTLISFLTSGATEYVIPEGVKIIGKNAFRYCGNLTRITFPKSLTEIDDNAFDCCYSLTEIALPEGLTRIGKEAFLYCEALERVSLPETLAALDDWAFYACAALTEIELPASLTALGVNPFAGSGIRTFILPPEHAALSTDGPALFDRSGRTLISCPIPCGGSYAVPDGVKTIAADAFFGSGLTSVTLPDDVREIASGAFSNCAWLESIVFSNRLQTIGEEAFYSCDALKTIELPGSLREIGPRAFFYSGLTHIALPEGVTTVCREAFAECNDLIDIFLPESLTSIHPNAFFAPNRNAVPPAERSFTVYSFSAGLRYVNAHNYPYGNRAPR